MVIGDFLARRYENDRAVRREARAQAARLLSFEWQRDVLAEEFHLGQTELKQQEVQLYHDRERRLAASHIFVSPLADQLVEPMQRLMHNTNIVVTASSETDEEWQAARDEFTAARDRFQESVRKL